RCSDMNLADYAASTRLVLRADAVLSRRPAFIITNSEAGKRHHVALGYRPKRWIDIPNGFDMTVFRPQPDAAGALRRELGLPDTARLAGMLARLDPMKDHGTFIAMAEQLAGREPDLHFLLAGRGCTAANAMLAAARQRLGGRLHLLGERQDVPSSCSPRPMARDFPTCWARRWRPARPAWRPMSATPQPSWAIAASSRSRATRRLSPRPSCRCWPAAPSSARRCSPLHGGAR